MVIILTKKTLMIYERLVPIAAPLIPNLGIKIKFKIRFEDTLIKIIKVCIKGKFAIKKILLNGM